MHYIEDAIYTPGLGLTEYKVGISGLIQVSSSRRIFEI